MRKAILSDIHGNLPALRRILDDIDRQDIATIYHLGDIFGSGANYSYRQNEFQGTPEMDIDCLDLLIRRCAVALLGNTDLEVILNKETAYAPLYEELCADTPQRRRRWEFLDSLPRFHTQPDGIMFFHGSPTDPLYGIVGRDELDDPERMKREFRMIHYLGFHGHTHYRDVVRYTPGAAYPVLEPPIDAEKQLWTFPKKPADGAKYFIGVGSAGKPRAGRPTPETSPEDEKCLTYAILEETETEYHVTFRMLR